jgi:hypothetical protein
MVLDAPNLRWRAILAALCILAAGQGACGRRQATRAPEVPASMERASPAQATRRPVEVAVPATGYAWDGRRSVALVRAPFGQVVDASAAALRRLNFELDTQASRRSVDSAVLIAAHSTGRQARVDIGQAAQGRSQVRVTLGSAGDRGASERLLDEINSVLGLSP